MLDFDFLKRVFDAGFFFFVARFKGTTIAAKLWLVGLTSLVLSLLSSYGVW